jgi:hypothetical protein
MVDPPLGFAEPARYSFATKAPKAGSAT